LAVRRTLAVVAGAAVAGAGALILGEYQFTWTLGPIAGVLFALFVAETVATVSRERGVPWAALSAALSAGGLGWAAWISIRRTGHGLPGPAWIAIVLGGIVGGVRLRPVSGPASGTRQDR